MNGHAIERRPVCDEARRPICDEERERIPGGHEPGFHIEEHFGSTRALCGFIFGDDISAPWHEGPYDCAECWRLQRKREAKK